MFGRFTAVQGNDHRTKSFYTAPKKSLASSLLQAVPRSEYCFKDGTVQLTSSSFDDKRRTTPTSLALQDLHSRCGTRCSLATVSNMLQVLPCQSRSQGLVVSDERACAPTQTSEGLDCRAVDRFVTLRAFDVLRRTLPTCSSLAHCGRSTCQSFGSMSM